MNINSWSVSVAFAPIDLTHRLETVLMIVEEGMQLFLCN